MCDIFVYCHLCTKSAFVEMIKTVIILSDNNFCGISQTIFQLHNHSKAKRKEFFYL